MKLFFRPKHRKYLSFHSQSLAHALNINEVQNKTSTILF